MFVASYESGTSDEPVSIDPRNRGQDNLAPLDQPFVDEMPGGAIVKSIESACLHQLLLKPGNGGMFNPQPISRRRTVEAIQIRKRSAP